MSARWKAIKEAFQHSPQTYGYVSYTYMYIWGWIFLHVFQKGSKQIDNTLIKETRRTAHDWTYGRVLFSCYIPATGMLQPESKWKTICMPCAMPN